MDKENLYKLKKLAQNLSILYIENDVNLQRDVGGFLKKLFTNVYTALDEEDGLEQYQSKKPSIVLTSLTLPNQNSLEMVIDIKGENSDAKIVILSDTNEDLELLQTIDLGIVEFLIKPFDINTLLDALLVAISQVQKQDKDTRCIEDLKTIKQDTNTLDFFSSYKGISIRKAGKLVNIQDDEFTVKIPYIEFIAMKYNQKTIINLPTLNKAIEANVFNVNKDKLEVTLINPHYISMKLFKLQQKRIKIDTTFQVGIHSSNGAIDAKVLDISYTSITFYIDNLESKLTLNDKVDLTMGVEIDSPSSVITEKQFSKVFANGHILKIEPYKQGYKVLALIKIPKSSQRPMMSYLKQRESEIIFELTRIIKGY